MKSFITYSTDCHFPIENLPYGIFSSTDNPNPRGGVAIGDLVLDVSVMETEGLMTSNYFSQPNLNLFMASGKEMWSSVRNQIQDLLDDNNSSLKDNSVFLIFLNNGFEG